jgi:hypothetical protein
VAVRALQRLRPSRRPFVNVIAEERSTNAFVPAVLDAPDNTYLCGYWQFEDYFIDHEAQIRRDFTFPPLNGTAEQLAAEIAAVSAVAVHVRRGDYVGDERFDIVDQAYYLRALNAIAEAVGEIHLFVFSDDPSWCRNMLQFVHPTTVVGHSVSDGRPWVDMQLMSRCQHHVVANSTYSWWGAWLNPSQEKIVVAPREWVRSEKRVGDPVPSSWIRV